MAAGEPSSRCFDQSNREELTTATAGQKTVEEAGERIEMEGTRRHKHTEKRGKAR